MWNVTVDKTWTADQTKRLQKMLNQYGFTDDGGNSLAVDGQFGPKSLQALQKMKNYQQQITSPSREVMALQTHLKDAGYKNPDAHH